MATSNPMQIGVVGLGRMGANIVRRLMRDGHTCVVFDVPPEAVKALEKEGATGATSAQTSSRSCPSLGQSGSWCPPGT